MGKKWKLTSMGFSRQEYWSGLPLPSPGYLPDPQVEPTPLKSPALAGGLFAPLVPPGKTFSCSVLNFIPSWKFLIFKSCLFNDWYIFHSFTGPWWRQWSKKNSGSSYFLRTKAIHFVNMYISCIYHPTCMWLPRRLSRGRGGWREPRGEANSW